jgi:hypothetical protein
MRLRVQRMRRDAMSKCDVDVRRKKKVGWKVFYMFFSAGRWEIVPFGGEKQLNVSPTVTARQ